MLVDVPPITMPMPAPKHGISTAVLWHSQGHPKPRITIHVKPGVGMEMGYGPQPPKLAANCTKTHVRVTMEARMLGIYDMVVWTCPA